MLQLFFYSIALQIKKKMVWVSEMKSYAACYWENKSIIGTIIHFVARFLIYKNMLQLFYYRIALQMKK